jgi:phosphotransferase family enzyme
MSETLSRARPRAVLWGNLGWHPAAAAWSAFAVEDVPSTPEIIEVLRKGKKSATYRLVGVGPSGESIIAQRSLAARATIERTVCEDILPHLPRSVRVPRYYGFWTESGQEFTWIFLEDLGNDRFAATDPTHRTLAGRWVGALHVAAAEIGAARALPDGGPARYLRHLRSGRETLRSNLTNPAIVSDGCAVLEQVVRALDALERDWSRIEDAGNGFPHTLAHGDIQRKNICVRNGAAGPELCLIDWETAGWGPPAVDLPKLDPIAYHSIVSDAWSGVRLDDVRRLATAGTILQLVAGIDWVSPELSDQRPLYVVRPVSWLRVYHERLTHALQELGDVT